MDDNCRLLQSFKPGRQGTSLMFEDKRRKSNSEPGWIIVRASHVTDSAWSKRPQRISFQPHTIRPPSDPRRRRSVPLACWRDERERKNTGGDGGSPDTLGLSPAGSVWTNRAGGRSSRASLPPPWTVTVPPPLGLSASAGEREREKNRID